MSIKNLDNFINRIAKTIILNVDSVEGPGLLTGNMGKALFLYNYSRYTQNKEFEKYAHAFIDSIYKELTYQTPIDFANGFTGIGWGIEYLVKNRFLKADRDLVLEEIDDIVFRSSLDQHYNDDLFGYGFYYIARLDRRKNNNDPGILSKRLHLNCLINDCEQILIHKKYSSYNIKSIGINLINSMIWFFLEIYRRNLIIDNKIELVFNKLSEEIDFYLRNSNDTAGVFQLYKLTKAIRTYLKDKHLSITLSSIILNQNKEVTHVRIVDKNEILNSYIKNTWQQLIFQPYSIKNGNTYFKNNFLSVTDNAEELIIFIEKNQNNMSLNGLAGLAYGLLLMMKL